MKDWLHPISYIGSVPVQDSEFCNKFPKDALTFLNSIISSSTLYDDHIESCLDKIIEFEPDLAEDKQYKHLKEYCRQNRFYQTS